MTENEQRNLFRAALAKWGEGPQLMMVIEEALELALAVARKSRGRGTVDDLAEECADVEIMLGQVRSMIGDRIVDKYKRDKLDRLRRRVEDIPLF